MTCRGCNVSSFYNCWDRPQKTQKWMDGRLAIDIQIVLVLIYWKNITSSSILPSTHPSIHSSEMCLRWRLTLQGVLDILLSGNNFNCSLGSQHSEVSLTGQPAKVPRVSRSRWATERTTKSTASPFGFTTKTEKWSQSVAVSRNAPFPPEPPHGLALLGLN